MALEVGSHVKINHPQLNAIIKGRVGVVKEIDTKSLPDQHPVYVVEVGPNSYRLQDFQLTAVGE